MTLLSSNVFLIIGNHKSILSFINRVCAMCVSKLQRKKCIIKEINSDKKRTLIYEEKNEVNCISAIEKY